MKQILAGWLLVLLLLCAAAMADDEQLCTLDLNALPETITTYSSYVCVSAALEDMQPVSISLYDAWDNLIYQRHYGYIQGSFRSEDIYLRLTSGATSYKLCAMLGDKAYESIITRYMPRLEDNIACSSGISLSVLTGHESRMSVTLLDIDALSEKPVTVPIHSAGVYELGTATFSLQDGCLLVSVQFDAGINPVITNDTVYVATSSVSTMDLDTPSFTGIVGAISEPIDLRGTSLVAVMVRLTVSFDPAGAAIVPNIELDGQPELWQQLMQQTESEAVG